MGSDVKCKRSLNKCVDCGGVHPTKLGSVKAALFVGVFVGVFMAVTAILVIVNIMNVWLVQYGS